PYTTLFRSIPGRRRDFLELGVLVAVRGIAGHDEEAPAEFARLQVVSRDVAARVVVCAGVAEDDDVARDLRRAARGVRAVLIDERGDSPNDGAGLRVEGEQTGRASCTRAGSRAPQDY